MTKRWSWLLLIAAVWAMAACATYETRPMPERDYRGFEGKIQNQQTRIDRGIRSGELTRHEAGVLQDNLNWIKRRFSGMQADGRLNPREMEKLDRMLESNSRMIFNKKHNPVERLY